MSQRIGVGLWKSVVPLMRDVSRQITRLQDATFLAALGRLGMGWREATTGPEGPEFYGDLTRPLKGRSSAVASALCM
jgi:hypothetical protein